MRVSCPSNPSWRRCALLRSKYSYSSSGKSLQNHHHNLSGEADEPVALRRGGADTPPPPHHHHRRRSEVHRYFPHAKISVRVCMRSLLFADSSDSRIPSACVYFGRKAKSWDTNQKFFWLSLLQWHYGLKSVVGSLLIFHHRQTKPTWCCTHAAFCPC